MWKPQDLESDSYREMKEHMRKYGGRDWNSMEFVEKYLCGYLTLINMNVRDNRKTAEIIEKSINRNTAVLTGFMKEVRKLNENMEKYLKISSELPFEFRQLKLRTECVIDRMNGGDGEMYLEKMRENQQKREETP